MDALSVYLDTSVIVPLFIVDEFSSRAQSFMNSHRSKVIVGDFAAAEFASALGIRCRKKDLKVRQGRAAFADFDAWMSVYALEVETRPVDIRVAETILRRLDLTLRTPDAIHIAISQRLGAELA